MIKLSQRLLALARLVPPGLRVADIGTDHALLPCYLVEEGIIPYAVGIDVHRGPYEAAWRSIRSHGLENKLEVRLGDGLKNIEPGEVEVVIIAGMGGSTIVEILEESPHVVRGLRMLILQPMNGSQALRRWLESCGWVICTEELVAEDGFIYEIIAARRGAGKPLSEIEASYGPILIKYRHPLLGEVLEKDLQKMQDILDQLAKSQSEEAKEKACLLRKKIQLIKELKQCLSTVRLS